MGNTPRFVESFGSYRQRLATVLDDTALVFEELGVLARSKDLAIARDKLLRDLLRVIVFGEMKRGKSTLLNAMLGESLLPTLDTVACTAIPTTVRHGEKRWVVAHRRPPHEPAQFDLSADPSILRKLLTVPERVDGPRADSDEQAIAEMPYTHADLCGPFEICQHGVELQDTAGLNEFLKAGEERGKTTWEQAKESDAAIVVWQSTNIEARSEHDALKSLIAELHDARVVFLLVNHVALPEESADRRLRAAASVRRTVIEYGMDEQNVFCVNAWEALKGRLTKNAALVEHSGIEAFESRLGEFLLHERSEAKLLPPLSEAERAVQEALADVVARHDSEPRVLESRTTLAAEQASTQLKDAERTLQRGETRLERASSQLRQDMEDAVDALKQTLLAGVASSMADVRFGNRDAIFDRASCTRELCDAASSWCQSEVKKWERSTLPRVVERHVDQLNDELEGVARSLEEARTTVLGLRKFAASELERKPGSTDLASNDAAVTVRLGRSLTVHASFEKGMSSSDASTNMLTFTIAGGAAGTVLGVITIGMIFPPAAIVGALLGAIFGGANAAARLREKTTEAIEASIRSHMGEVRTQIADAVEGQINAMKRDVVDRLRKQLAEIRRDEKQIAGIAVQARAKSGELRDHYGKLRSRLQGHARELDEIRRAMDGFGGFGRLEMRLRQVFLGSGSSQPSRSAEVPNDERVTVGQVIEPKGVLSEEGLARLTTCANYLSTLGGWNQERQSKLAEWWSILETKVNERRSGPKGDKQIVAYRAITAIAAAEGASMPPKPEEFAKRWRDPEYRGRLLQVYTRVDPTEDTDAFTDDDAGEYGKGGMRICKRYERALTSVAEIGRRPGTIITDEEREPYR